MAKKNFQKTEEEEIVEKEPRHFIDVADEIHALEDQEPRDKRKTKDIAAWTEKMNKLISEYNTLRGEKVYKIIK